MKEELKSQNLKMLRLLEPSAVAPRRAGATLQPPPSGSIRAIFQRHASKQNAVESGIKPI
jgi:hypothetical protein